MVVMSEEPQSSPAKAKKSRSQIKFPYYPLDDAIRVARMVRDRGGGRCTLDQLARFVNAKSTDSGAFRSLIAATSLFGLVTASSGQVGVTDQVGKILSPVYEDDERQGRIEAFLSVPLFKAVYEHYRGQALPAEPGTKNALEHQFGVVKEQVATAYRVLMESADQAGFFATGRTHLVEPPAKGAIGPPSEAKEAPRGGGGPPSDEPPGIDPALLGLLRHLPKSGTAWRKDRKEAWLQAFNSTIGVLYPEEVDTN
ncbi:MAG: hypothetical protein WBF37_08420 [Dehalococcoidia bacterium]